VKNISIAIDGPAGAGKSTIAKKIASIMNLIYIDTGSMYRALTLKLLSRNVNFNNIELVKEIINETEIEILDGSIYLDGKNVDEEIRSPRVNENVSKVAALPFVRERMVALQREIAKNNDVIMDGRDIGTRVLRDAKYKFYITATINERAYRRYKELNEKGYNYNLKDVIEEMSKRDKMDSEREIDPLKMAKDAVLIDTTGKTINDVVREILDKIK